MMYLLPSFVALVDNASMLTIDVTAAVTAQMGAMRWSALHAMGTNVQMENAFPTWTDVTVNLTAQMGATSWIASWNTINPQS